MPDELESYLDPIPHRRRYYDDLILKHSQRTGLDPELVRAVVEQESGGNPHAVSPKGAQGIGQLMPATAKRFGVKNVFDPDENLRGATDYLRFLNDRYKGNRDLVLAGYNAGEGAVDKFGGIPPYRETRNYVKSINAKLGQQKPQGDLEQYLDPLESYLDPTPTPTPTPKPTPKPLSIREKLKRITGGIEGIQGPLEAGNIDLTNRPRVRNRDGSISTVRSVSVNIDGREVLLPTISDDGRKLSMRQAVEQYRRTGKHLGIFRDPASANYYAQQLHQQQAEQLRQPQTIVAEGGYERTRPGQPGLPAELPSMQARQPGIVERVTEAVKPYVPGLTSLDTPMGIKTDPIRGLVRGLTLGAFGDPREITPEQRLIDPEAETRRDVAEFAGETLGSIAPYVGTSKALGAIPMLSKATRAAHIARTGATFGLVDVARQAIRTAKTGQPPDPQEAALSTAIGATIGGIAGVNPSMKRQIVAFLSPQIAVDVARGTPAEQAIQNGLINLGFALTSGAGWKPTERFNPEVLQPSRPLEPEARAGIDRAREDMRRALEERRRARETEAQPNVTAQPETEPPVVYHSGTTPFEQMEVERTKVGSKGRGLYFAPTPEATQVYEIAKRGKPSQENVKAARLDMKAPLDLMRPESVDRFIARLDKMSVGDYEMASKLSARWGRAQDADALRQNVRSVVEASRNAPQDYIYNIVRDNPNLTALAKSLGYDGIVDQNESVVFDRSQIRSVEDATKSRQRFYHKQFGEVEVLSDQTGAGKNRYRVAEVANPDIQHFVKKSALTGAGNIRMVPIAKPTASSTGGRAEPDLGALTSERLPAEGTGASRGLPAIPRTELEPSQRRVGLEDVSTAAAGQRNTLEYRLSRTLNRPAQVGDVNAALSKSGLDGSVSHAEFFSDLANSETFRNQGLRGFDIPTQRIVMQRVLSVINDPQIRNSVVESIPVDVVDILSRAKSATEVILHDGPMVSDRATKQGENVISLPVEIADSLVRKIAIRGTELPAFFRTGQESDAALGASGLYARDRTHDTTLTESTFARKQSESSLGQYLEPEATTVPERPETIDMQMQALQEGRRDAVLIPRGTPRPDIPKGMTIERTPEGMMYFDPNRISRETVKQKLANGTWHELLGHVEPKPLPGEPTATVTAKERGAEVQSSVVRPERALDQAIETQARHPEAQVEVGGPELAHEMIAQRIAPAPLQESRLHETTDQRINRVVREFLSGEEGGFDLARVRKLFKRKSYEDIRLETLKAVPKQIADAAQRHHELGTELFRLNIAIGDAGRPDSTLSKREVDALWSRHQKALAEITPLESFIIESGYKINMLGEVVKKGEAFPSSTRDRPLMERVKRFLKGEEGSLDIEELRNRIRHLLQDSPNLSDEQLKKQLQEQVGVTEPQKFGPGAMRVGEPLPEVKGHKFGQRLMEDDRIVKDLKDSLGTSRYYEPLPNKVTVAQAKGLVDKRGIGESIKIVKDESNDLEYHVRVAMGEIVLLRLNQTYKNLKSSKPAEAEFVLEQETDMAEFMMDYGLKLGRGVQAFATWSRLTPEGMLLTYKRGVQKARERQGKLFGSEIKEVIDTANKPLTDAERLAELKKLFSTNRVARKVKGDLEKLIKASKDGKLTDNLFYEIAGDKLGLPTFNKEIAGRITDYAQRIADAPEGLPRNKIILELQKYIAEQKGFDTSDLPLGIFYGNILSGYNTHIVNFVDTGLNVLFEVNGLAMTNPRAAAGIYAGMLRGFAEGRFDAIRALTEGRLFKDSKWLEAGNLMEVARFGRKGGVPIKETGPTARVAKRLAESPVGYPLNAYKYVSRLMAASDSLFVRSAQEARAALLAYRMAKAEGLEGQALENRAREILAQDRIGDFVAQARREGFSGNEANYRAVELRDMARSKDLSSDTAEFAGEATYNHTPHGTLGLIAESIGRLTENVKPLKLFVPFTRIVANVTNRGLNWTPYGFKRAQFGWGFGKYAEPLTPEGRQQALVRASLGTAGMVLLGGLQHAGLLEIHGNGPTDREKRRQLQNAGWRPYSLKIGDTYVSYLNSPIGLGLSILGNWFDTRRYHELEQKDAATRAAYTVSRLGSTVFSQSFLSGLTRLFDALSDESSKSVDGVKRTLSGTAGSMVVPNLARDTYRLFDNKAYQSNTLMEDLIRNTPFAALALRPTLNAFGEPVRLQRQRFFDVLSSDPAWRYVVKRNLRVPVPGRTAEVEKGVRITPEQYYDLLKNSGPQVREWIIANQEILDTMTDDDAQDALSNAASRIRKAEMARIKVAYLSAKGTK